MKLRAKKDIKNKEYLVRFAVDEFHDDEIYHLVRFGPFTFNTPVASFMRLTDSWMGSGSIEIKLEELPDWQFKFNKPDDANRFIEQCTALLNQELASFISNADEFVGEELFELRAGAEVKRINEGARRALDRDSEEYREIIEKNREAFAKLSKL